MRWLEVGDVIVVAAQLDGLEPSELAGHLDLEAVAAALAAVRQDRADAARASAMLFTELSRRRAFGESSLRLAWACACQLASLNGLELGSEASADLVALLREIARGGGDVDRLVAWMRRLAAPARTIPTTEEEGSRMSEPRGLRRTLRLRGLSGSDKLHRFTDRARRAMVLAQEEARLLNHNFIGTEHLLLGLLLEGDGVAAQALEGLGVSVVPVREKVQRIIGPSASLPTSGPPFTPRAKKVMELSLREALQLGHNYIGTEHLLLGLLREGEGVAVQVLKTMGAHPARVRQQVIQVLASYNQGEATPAELRDRVEASVSALLESNARLEAEVERLHSILRAHGITPGKGERSA